MIGTPAALRPGSSPDGGPRRLSLRFTCGSGQSFAIFTASSVMVIALASLSLLIVRAQPIAAGPRGLGAVGRLVLGGLARSDVGPYLTIAQHGYGQRGPLVAYFPLYPLLVRVIGVFSESRGVLLVAASAVSLGCFAAALVALRRLVVIELGERAARPTLLLLAFFPAAVFLVAPYAESLLLLLAVGSVLAARTGRWAVAAGLATAACAARPSGITLLAPLVLLYLYGPRADARPLPERHGLKPRYAIGREALWLAVAPLGLIAYLGYLWALRGDPLAYQHAALGHWHLGFAPFAAVWRGPQAAGAGLLHLLSGAPAASAAAFAQHHAADPTWVSLQNVYLVGFLLIAGVAAVGVWRLLPPAYFGYVVANAFMVLSVTESIQPLMGLPRYLIVVFPLFMWLGHVAQRRRLTSWMLTASVIGLSAFTIAFAAGRWVA